MLGFGMPFDPSKDIPDLSGKVALVTGGNAGIGFQIVQHLAIHGAKVYLGARSEERATAAIAKIEQTHQFVKEKRNITWLPLDLTHPADVVISAKDFISREDRLDILVNNAARLGESYTVLDGVELSIAINHVGHQVLVEQLMSILKATAARPNSDVRICIVSSYGHYFIRTPYHVDTIENLSNPWPGFSGGSLVAALYRGFWLKLLNEWFKIELQRRVNADNLDMTVLSVSPGTIATENSFRSLPRFLHIFLYLFARSPEVGGNSALIATTSPLVKQQPEKYQGAFLNENGVPIAASAVALNKERAAELWRVTSEIIEKSLGS